MHGIVILQIQIQATALKTISQLVGNTHHCGIIILEHFMIELAQCGGSFQVETMTSVLVKQSPRSNQNFEGKVSVLREVENTKNDLRSFEATLTNTGDKILDARAFLALANLETAEEKQFNPKPVTIYPEQKRKLILTLPENLGPGQYALAFLLDYGHRSAIEGAQILLSVEQ